MADLVGLAWPANLYWAIRLLYGNRHHAAKIHIINLTSRAVDHRAFCNLKREALP